MSLDYGSCPAIPRAFLCPCSPSLLPECCHPGLPAVEPLSRQHTKNHLCGLFFSTGSQQRWTCTDLAQITTVLWEDFVLWRPSAGTYPLSESLLNLCRSRLVLGNGDQRFLKNDNGRKTTLPLTVIREFSDFLSLSLDQFTLKVDWYTGVCHCN